MKERTKELLDRLTAPGSFPGVSCSEGHEIQEGATLAIDQLERALEILDDLAGLASYAEIVGGVSVNRGAIRNSCDAAFALIKEIRSEEE
jgi:hypothetical protein